MGVISQNSPQVVFFIWAKFCQLSGTTFLAPFSWATMMSAVRSSPRKRKAEEDSEVKPGLKFVKTFTDDTESANYEGVVTKLLLNGFVKVDKRAALS